MAVLEFKRNAKPSSGDSGGETATLEWADAAGNAHSCEIVIGERGPRGLVASSASAPPLNQVVRLREPGSTYYVVVRSVSGSSGAYSSNLEYSYAGRRKEERRPVSVAATATYVSPGQALATNSKATVSDISAHGLRLTTREALPVGVEVRVSGDALDCVGRTVYCEMTGPDFQTGVQLNRGPQPAG